ncbi:MAG: NUDIX hydrolase [Planctomycetes bacterium]|nr:NUDIX hydrolase [Planctomycetota bacterium]
MHRRALIALLHRHAEVWPDQAALAERFLAFVGAHPDCLLRSCRPGHVTASAWILSPDGRRALLTHHRKLGRWLQLGGHVDGEPRVERAALREAQEESGLAEFELLTWSPLGLVPLDLDVHPIPARGAEPWHEHWDVRFLLRARREAPLRVSAESNDVRWLPTEELAAFTAEASVLRLQQRAVALGFA